jgi:tetratricopeptide (TPR) repeat protein
MLVDVGHHFAFAKALLVRNDTQRALLVFQKALRLDPTHTPSQLGIVESLVKLGRGMEACCLLTQTLQTEPGKHDPALYILLAKCLGREGLYDQAITVVNKAFELSLDTDEKDAVRLNSEMFSAYLNLGKLDLADFHIKEVLAYQPGNDAAYFNLGTLYRARYMFGRAEECYKKAIELNPKLQKAKDFRIICLCFLNRFEEAKEILSEISVLREYECTYWC